jgi:hypothetical protein
METINFKPKNRLPIVDCADVVVIGGGPSGFAAAMAAARSGSSVVLIEKTGRCGGVATMGLPIQGFDYANGMPLVRGVAWELYRNLVAIGGALQPLVDCSLHNPYAIIDPEYCALEIQRMLHASGVRVWNHTHFVQAIINDSNGIDHIVVSGKGGLAAIGGRFWIDATGDGDLMADIGIPFSIGRESDSLPQSATVNFSLANVDLERFGRSLGQDDGQLLDTHPQLDRNKIIAARPHIMVGLRNLIAQVEKETGAEQACSYVCYITGLSKDTVTINMTHVPYAMGHTLEGLSNAEQEGRRQVLPIYHFLTRWVPGFEHATISRIACHVGIRESRHIKGRYTLTGADIQQGRSFEDTIALGGYPIDIHNPEKGDVFLQKVPPYGIPFRCMQIIDRDDMLFTGRALSADHVALASCRLMAPCMAMGEACGVAAHLSLKEGGSPQPVEISVLLAELRMRNAVLVPDGEGMSS